MPGTLENLVEEGYRLFGGYKLRGLMEVCLCNVCMLPEQQREISSVPLRQMSSDLIREYTNSAHGVPSDTDELKYILPRYLEMLASGECPSDIGFEVALKRFGDARRKSPKTLAKLAKSLRGKNRSAKSNVENDSLFSAEEAAFFDNFLLAVLSRDVASQYDDIDETLIMLAGAGVDLSVAVDLILADASGFGPDAIARLASGSASNLVLQGRLENDFWNPEYQDQMQAVIADMLKRETIEVLEQAALAIEDPKRAQVISDGHAVLESAAAQYRF